MKETSIFKSNEGQKKIEAHYEAYKQSLPFAVEEEFVETSYGKTHVLITGPKEGKPLFVLQGGNCINPMTLSWFISLADTYRIYAPDTIVHPGFSEQRRLNAKDDTFANWLAQLMDHYGVAKGTLIGPSYGGGMILRLATFLPERVEAAVLACPAGLKLGSKLQMIKDVLLPMMIFLATGSRKHLNRLTDRMSSGHMKDIDRTIIGDIFKYVKLEQEMPKTTTREELRNYQAPTLIIGGSEDIFFPSAKLQAATEKVFSTPVHFIEYKMGHFPSEEQLRQIEGDIRGFLKENA